MRNIITLFLALFISISAFAAAGDDCSTAISISSNGCSTAGAYNNTGVTGTLMPPACFGAGNNNGMWFKFIATMPVVNITVNGGTLVTPMVGLFSSTVACGSPFLELGCSNPGTIAATLPYSSLVVGNTYYIYVDGANNTTGTFQLCLTSPSQPSNDSPCNPITLPTTDFCSGANAYTNLGATDEPLIINGSTISQPGCFVSLSNINTVYFAITATGTKIDVVINGNSLVRPQVGLIQLSGGCTVYAGYSSLACASASAGSTTSLSIANAIAGTTYLIMVDGANANTGSFEICVNSYNPIGTVTNDNCSTATILCPGNNYFATTNGATPNTSIDPHVATDATVGNPDGTNSEWGGCNGVVDNSVWFTFTTTNPVSPISFSINSDCYDLPGGGTQYPNGGYLQYNVFKRKDGLANCANHVSSNNGSWTTLGCTVIGEGTASGALSISAASMLPNTQYYIVVDNYPGCACDFDFTITGNQGAAAGVDQTVCLNAPAFNLTGFSPLTGATWSGPGITNSVTGTFNPATAGIGSHLLYLTYGPCTDSKRVIVTGPTVVLSNSVTICPLTCSTLLGVATQPTVIVTNPSFSIAPNTTIPTNSTFTTTSTINVSGLDNASLSSICLNINHTKNQDLDIYLVCPGGTTLELSTDNGANQDNYTGTCFSSGASVSITGGNSPFSGSYVPEGGALTTLNSCTMNGNWTLLVIDDGGGSDGGTFLNWTLTFQNTVTNTIPATSFTWNPTTAMTGGSTLSPTVCPISTTVYSLTGTDANGCKATDATTVVVIPVTITVTPSSTLCVGSSKTLTATGATTYSWSPATGLSSTSGSSVIASPSVTTTYTVIGTLGVCTNTTIVTITVTSPTLSVVSPSYCIGSSGNLSASGASTYTWSPTTGLSPTTGATVTASPTITTTYSVIGTTTAGCIGTQTAVVTVNPKPQATLSFTNPTCGNSNGIININNTSCCAQTISSFTSSLGSVSGQTVTGLGAVTPIITLANSFGCTFTVSTTLTMTPSPTAITTSTTNATCGLSNGSITFTTPTSGTAPFTYSVNNVSSTSPTSSLSAGTYSLLVKDFNGCTFTKTLTITNIPGPTAVAGNTAQASCNTNNGSFTVTGVTGGTPTYSFAVDAAALSTSSVTGGLSAGTHTITVKDASSCTFTRTFSIGTANGPSSFSVNTTNSNCGLANGTSTVSNVVGGSPTYSFSFDGGTFATTTTTTGLMAGTHTMTIKDANSCTITATYSVGNNAPPTASVTNSINILCNAGSTGSFTTTPVGNAPFTYTLTSPVQTNTTGIFTGLAANTYSVIVKDIFGCTVSTTVTLTQPTQVTATVSSIPVNCFGNSTGSVSVGGAGGVGPYTYLWPALSSSTLATTGGAAAGTYTVTIKDANLCTITKTVTVTQPTSLTLTSTLTPATCGNANGSGTVTIAGGTTTYSYNWSNGGITNILTAASEGTYTINVQDFNGCVLTKTVAVTNIPGPTAITGTTTLAGCGLSNGTYNVTGVTGGTSAYTFSVDAVATASLTTGLAAGTHTISVSDFNSCLFSTTFTITTASGPTSATVLTTNASCGTANGTSTVTAVTGGLATYQYSFDGGGFSTVNTTTGLSAGPHTVIIKDVNSCTLTVPYTEFNNSGPTASVTNSIHILCNNGTTGSFTVTPVGGISPYTYTLTSPVQTNTTGVFSGLPAGAYNITVSDNSGCTATASVTLTEPTALTLTVTSLPVNCFGSATGTVSASGSGGAGSYTYLWPTLASNTLSTVNNVAAATYSVTQTDANGCSITKSVTVTQPTSLTLTSTLTPATCGNANGSGTVTVDGGTPAYSYNWSNGGITNTLIGASGGTYTLNVTDFNGCVLTRTLTITNIPGPTAITGTTTLAGCGLLNGTYNITGVTGGTSPYTYSVDAIATGSLTGGLGDGTHTVTVSDFNSCLYSTTFNIGTAIGPATASITTNNATCGSANGTSTVISVTGGLPAYQYSFDGGSFTAGASTTGLIAGSHTVTIKDANSCSLTVTYNVSNNGSPTASILSSTNTSCFAGSNGGFAIAGSGGSGAPYTYTLTTPFQNSGTGVFTGLTAGTYSIITNDNAGCAVTTTVNITEPTLVTLTPSSIPVKCFGTSTGTINIAGAGGTSPYQYSLNGAGYQASNSYTSVGANIYNLSIQDFKGCTATQTVEVTQPAALAIQVATQNANCTAANGIATTTVSGGTPIYTYTWTGGAGASATSNSVVTGSYTVTVTDANGCVKSEQAVIGLTPGGAATITALTNITCNGANDGSMTADMIGGSAPFTYSWSPGGQTVAHAIGLSPTSYTCEITDFYGCKAYANGTLAQPSILNAIMNSNNVKCYGTATGTVSAAGTGGIAPYTYMWSTIPSTLSTLPNVALGIYTCTITDDNGCVISPTIGVTQPTSITLTSTVTAANCNQANGSATVIASGGAPGAYTYTWSAGSTPNSANQGSLFAGTYTIMVQDANNCTEIVSATIPNIAGPLISVTSQTNVSCYGGCNGIATTSVSGGVGTYIYSWSNGNVSSIATNLCAQIYTVSVTDEAGCVASTSVSITEPSALTVTIVPTDPKCYGSTNGFGVASALGGTPDYTYTWTGLGGTTATSNPVGAGNYGLTVTDGNGCVVTSSMALVNPPQMTASISSTNVSCFGLCNGTAIANTTNGVGIMSYYWIGGASPISGQTANGLCMGTYTMIATDQNNCTAPAIISITQPPLLTASISATGSVTCYNGTNGFAIVDPAGGTPTYSYSWSGDAATNGNSTNANTLPAGIYTVTVTDTKGCSATANATIFEPTPLVAVLTATNAKCNGVCDGAANINFSGGTGAITFLWQPGLQSGNSVNNLCAGNQTVTITSNGSCSTVLNFTITEPAPLTAIAQTTVSHCGQNDGRACATVTGGTSPLSYLWSNGANTLCNNNILAGAHTFTVTDVNGCIAITSGPVSDVAAPLVSVTSQTNVSCFNKMDGAATATISGGVPNYTISWTGNQASANTTANPTNFGFGLHNIVVVDAAGCVGTATVDIIQPTQLVSAIGSSTNVTCYGLTNGGATILANGGSTPYSYAWTLSTQTSSVLINVGANTYTGTVTDNNGCTTTSSVIIAQPQALAFTTPTVISISCAGFNNGQIFAGAIHGSPGYNYLWTPAQPGNSGTIGSLAQGNYSLTVTDQNSCSIDTIFNVSEPPPLSSSYTALPATCNLTNGSATVTVLGGSPTYTLNWNTSPVQQGFIASNMASANYQCVITDSKGCSITQTVGIANPTPPRFLPYTVIEPTCFGASNGSITVNYADGLAPYTLSWPSPLSQTITNIPALTYSMAGIATGSYPVVLTDSYGCTTSQGIYMPTPQMVTLVADPDKYICYGQSTQLNAMANGGSRVYTYTWLPDPFTTGGPNTVNPTTTTFYTVSVVDSKGCTASPTIIAVYVSKPLTVISKSITLCHLETAVLTPTMTSFGNGLSYTYNWSTSPVVTTESLSVTGNAPTIATTNTFEVIVSDGCTIPYASAIFTVNTNPLPVISFTANPRQGCAPLNVMLTALSPIGAEYEYAWQEVGLMGNPQYATYADSGKHTVTLVVTNTLTGCSDSKTEIDYIEVYPQPIAQFYPDPQTTSILDPNINYINTSQGAVSYYWDFGDIAAINGLNNTTVINPSHYYSLTGIYTTHLIATSIKGCKSTFKLNVEITPDFALYIPNAFTPDDNKLNDMFQPMGVGINEDNYRMDIFDRWGENIFTSNSFRKGWDGTVKGGSKLAPQGVYIYKLMVYDMQGNKHPFVGHVTVIRREE